MLRVNSINLIDYTRELNASSPRQTTYKSSHDTQFRPSDFNPYVPYITTCWVVCVPEQENLFPAYEIELQVFLSVCRNCDVAQRTMGGCFESCRLHYALSC